MTKLQTVHTTSHYRSIVIARTFLGGDVSISIKLQDEDNIELTRLGLGRHYAARQQVCNLRAYVGHLPRRNGVSQHALGSRACRRIAHR